VAEVTETVAVVRAEAGAVMEKVAGVTDCLAQVGSVAEERDAAHVVAQQEEATPAQVTVRRSGVVMVQVDTEATTVALMAVKLESSDR
jgi:hypothetical protein